MNVRNTLPPRRRSMTSEFQWMNQHVVTVTLGFYPGGGVAEIFATAGKSGEQLEAAARDAVIIASIAMQYGAPLDTILRALTRDDRGAAGSLAGAILDHVEKMLEPAE